jgi:hypothetical protein
MHHDCGPAYSCFQEEETGGGNTENSISNVDFQEKLGDRHSILKDEKFNAVTLFQDE